MLLATPELNPSPGSKYVKEVDIQLRRKFFYINMLPTSKKYISLKIATRLFFLIPFCYRL